ncbi:hypothetical protein Tco_0758953 [Tanacetum coccineum]
MSMTIQSSVKDKILATIKQRRSSEYEYEIRYHLGKANVVTWCPKVRLQVRERTRRKILGVILTKKRRREFVLYGSYMSSVSREWSPVLWAEIGESSLTGPELVLDMTDKVVLIKEKLKAARDRQKSYADNRRKPLEFEVGDRVMLKVSPWKGVIRFGKKGKLAPSLHVPLDEIKVDKTLRFVEEPVENSDREVKRGGGEDIKFDNQSIEHDRLIGIGIVLDFVEFILFTFSDKEMILVIEAVSR